MEIDTDRELRYGQMGLSMKENGRITRPMVMENLSMRMEMFMKENGSMIRLTARVFISTLMEQGIRVSGKMTCKMALESRCGLMVANMREITERG